jgi:methylaspartate ammonia-lyase
MKIVQPVFSRGLSAFFFDDQRAIKKGAGHDGFVYVGEPVTPKFTRIREAGQSISIQLMLADGQVALGDCAAIQYSGAGGRDPLFLADEYIAFLNTHLRPLLTGLEVTSFKSLVERFMPMEFAGARLHNALRYGLSQAFLDAVAKASHQQACEVVCREYGLPVVAERVPVFGQTGDNRYENVDKMILKGVEVLPHGLINNIPEKLGNNGEKLREYIRWLVARIEKLRVTPAYRPSLHIDVYGTIGIAFNYDFEKIADFLASLEKDAGGLPLAIEGPVDMEEKPKTIDAMRRITAGLATRGSNVKIVADEWCNTLDDVHEFVDAKACHIIQVKTPVLGGIENTIESVLYCKKNGVGAYQGGTCNETDVSARLCVQLAMATRPDQMLAKPGMGFDEGYTIVNNEMERIIAYLRWKKEGNIA